MSTKYCINCGAACMQTMRSCPTCGNRNFSVSPVTKPPEAPPLRGAQTGDREFAVDRGWGGHFYLTAYVNGKSVNFLVDTGATTVLLTSGDAKKVGFNLDLLTYNQPYESANGTGYAATVRLKEIRIGSIQARNVGGSVIPDNDKVSLLGMSFLNRLSGFEINGNTMVLKP